MLVVVRGAGDLASGIAVRLVRAGAQVVMCDVAQPTAVRRTVAFSEAIRLGATQVEDVRGVLVRDAAQAASVAKAGDVAVLVDEDAHIALELHPQVLVDAILAKRNLGTTMDMAPVVIGVGPGFTARLDCHAAVETKRGHELGRVYYEGAPIANTGIPGIVAGHGAERVLRAPADGAFEPVLKIGDIVHAGQVAAYVAGEPLLCTIDGVLRGLLQAGVPVTRGMKSGDIDPRPNPDHCLTVSDKARAVGGGVLEAMLHCTGTLEA